jgi:hypothetical protein
MNASGQPRFVAWLLAAVLLITQAAALAHEYDHALGQHEAPCALHAYCQHGGKGLASNAPVTVTVVLADTPHPESAVALTSRAIAAYAARAPPTLSRLVP